MEAKELLKNRRSIRKFKNKKVDRDTLKEIVDVSRYAPSWANFQVARYTFVDDDGTIKKIAADGVKGFIYNVGTLEKAQGVLVLSYVKGKSGKLDTSDYATSKENSWEIFDAGIACQTFCLAAHEKGVGTVVMGVIDDESISKIVKLPDDETVAALIVYGYPDESPQPTPRKEVHEIIRFV